MADAKKHKEAAAMPTSMAPWLSVQNSVKAIEFYKSAFGAFESYRLESPDGGLVAKLSVDEAEFWVSGSGIDTGNSQAEILGGNSVHIILTVADPDALFKQAVNAGASEVFPVAEEYGWRLGRIVDPFGLHWEIGHPLGG